jgi:hypothetical protein
MSQQTISEYRRLGRPAFFFLPLHNLEVRNAILHRAFFQRHSKSQAERQRAVRDRDAAFGRLEAYSRRKALIEVHVEWDAVFAIARGLSDKYTERLGARTIDILHVANALALEAEQFLTTDARQADLAIAEGLNVAFVE